jgi:tRNA(Ile)-lysidine synthase
MDATKTLPPNKLQTTFQAHVSQHVAPDSRVCVALSGGVDSVVLLHLFAQLRSHYPLTLSAIHIHHGISPNADAWAQFCQQICAELDIPIQTYRISLARSAELGLEAAARLARYAQFRHQPADFIALAHHRDDQAETFMLQLLRGAGVKGLSGMPVIRQQSGEPGYLRPLLDVDRSDILDWAKQRQLQWIEDESNQDSRYARNFLRHEILPLLNQRYPAWRATIARSAQNLAEAAELLDELAQLDAAHAIRDRQINCTYLAAISPARARNLLRYFLALHDLAMPSQIQLMEMLEQLTHAGMDSHIAIDHDGHTLHRYRDYGYLLKQLPVPDRASRWHWQGEKQLSLPKLGGTLSFEREQAPGIDLQRLNDINIRLRQGGEMFRPDCRRPNRRLKTLLQTANIPPWQREHTPLIYSGDTLIHVPGIGTACGWQATPGDLALCISWHITD